MKALENLNAAFLRLVIGFCVVYNLQSEDAFWFLGTYNRSLYRGGYHSSIGYEPGIGYEMQRFRESKCLSGFTDYTEDRLLKMNGQDREIKEYITPCNTVIITINILVFIASFIIEKKTGDDVFTEKAALAWWRIFEEGEYYRLFTYMFLHGNLPHIFNNMLVLGFVGSRVEHLMGSIRYTLMYFATGVIAGTASCLYNRWTFMNGADNAYIYGVGASGAIFGIVGALLFIVLINHGRVEQISTRQMIAFIVLSIYAGLVSTGIDNTAHIAGVIFGFISAMVLYDRRRNTGAG